jgi:uncharacterized membrane protein
MQDVAQLVRALVCGAGGRGFEPHLPAKSLVEQTRLFCCYYAMNLLQLKSLITVRYQKTTFIVVSMMYLAGTIGLLLPQTQPYFKLASPFNLWVSLILLLLFHQDFNKSFIFTAIFILLTGFFVEVLGVHTGMIFGKYWYGQTLGTQFLDVPLVIGANWLLLVYCSAIVTQNIFSFSKKYFAINSPNLYTFTQAIFSSILMVFLDFFIEPVAIKLDFWHWQNEQIPTQNFQAWFILSFVLNCLFLKSKFLKINLFAPLLLFLQFLFFWSIYIFYSFF